MTQLVDKITLTDTFTNAGTHLGSAIDVKVTFSSIVQTIFTYDVGLTSVMITIQGSIDGVNYTDIDTQTPTENGDIMFCLSLCPVHFLRMKVVLVGTGNFNMTTNVSKAA